MLSNDKELIYFDLETTMFTPNTTPMLDPKNDFIFKKLFVMAPTLLIALINAVRTEEVPIESIEILNPTITPEDITGKFIVLDILARDTKGQHFNIEMQVRRYNAWRTRSAFYMARSLTQQIKSGQDYQAIQPVIGIHLLDFDLFEEPEHQYQAHWCFEMRDRQQHDVKLGDELELHIIEMRKADRLGIAPPDLAAWLSFFEHWQEESIMSNITYAPVQQALVHLKTFSEDEQMRHQAFVRERALMDEISEKRAEREIGERIGEARGEIKGEIKGKREEAINILMRLLTRRFGTLSDDTLDRLNIATTEQLEHWIDIILDAKTQKAVFDGH